MIKITAYLAAFCTSEKYHVEEDLHALIYHRLSGSTPSHKQDYLACHLRTKATHLLLVVGGRLKLHASKAKSEVNELGISG